MPSIALTTTTIVRTRPNPQLTFRSFLDRVYKEINAEVIGVGGRVCLRFLEFNDDF